MLNFTTQVGEPSIEDDGGQVFGPTSASDASSCADTLGRDCVINVLYVYLCVSPTTWKAYTPHAVVLPEHYTVVILGPSAALAM